MSHRTARASFVLTSFLVVIAVRAQQPSTDAPPAAQSGQPQVNPTPPAETPSKSEPTPPAVTPAKSEHAVTDIPKKAASTSAQLTSIVVNGGPSADILRSARNAGFKIKIANGTTHFCKTEAPIGTHFVSESCMNEDQVTLWLSRARDQRDQLQHVLGAPAVAQ